MCGDSTQCKKSSYPPKVDKCVHSSREAREKNKKKTKKRERTNIYNSNQNKHPCTEMYSRIRISYHGLGGFLFVASTICVLCTDDSSSSSSISRSSIGELRNQRTVELYEGTVVSMKNRGLDVTATIDYKNDDGTYDIDMGGGRYKWRVKADKLNKVPTGL